MLDLAFWSGADVEMVKVGASFWLQLPHGASHWQVDSGSLDDSARNLDGAVDRVIGESMCFAMYPAALGATLRLAHGYALDVAVIWMHS